ncbi:MAG: response regulator [Subdoligranulum sp.]|nr:response regulator [Subdoligranulum sp.]
MGENDVIRVLIAEDDPIQRELLCDAMKMERDIVCCGQARDGVEALEVLLREEPDVLLLDIVMPNMDGVDLLYELQELSPAKRPRIIAISAFGQEHIAQTVLAQGADWFLLKPYRFDLLFHRIRILVNQDQDLPVRNIVPDKMISNAVMELGIPTNSLGYSYLVQALTILHAHQGVCLLGKDVYAVIAGPNRTTAQCVEKALRKAIRQVFEADSDALHRILRMGGVEQAKHLSNGRFLTLMAEAIWQKEY